MGHSNGKITAPISLHADVYPVLGLSKSGTYYDLGYVCGNAHKKINPYSKYKPVIYPDLGTNCVKGEDYWYRSYNNLYSRGKQPCGIKVNLLPNTGEIKRENLDKQVKWNESYAAPTGGTNAPYRLTDFNGYDHNAKIPFQCTYPTIDITVGDDFTGDGLKCFFDCFFLENSLTSNYITIADLSTAFLHSPPSDSYGIVGFLAFINGLTNIWVKTKKVSASDSMQLVDINISETKETSFYNSATVSGRTTYLYPIIANKEIPNWSYISDAGSDFEVIMGTGEFSGWRKSIQFHKISVAPEYDYAINYYKYGSNFKTTFAPLQNEVPYNGSNSVLDFEMEIIAISTRASSLIGNNVKVMPEDYTIKTVHGATVNGTNPVVTSAGGSKVTVQYAGKSRNAYRWNRVQVKGMYQTMSGGYSTGTGTCPVTWKFDNGYTTASTLYLYCGG